MSAYIIRADGIREIHFDGVESETHPDVSMVTEHPVETGTNIIDHVRSEPAIVSLQVLVSNTPIRSLGAIETQSYERPAVERDFDGTPGGLWAAGEALFGSPAPIVIQAYTMPDEDRIEVYQQTLNEIRLAAELVAVVTMSRVYYDCLLIRSELSRTQFGAGSFALDFRRINVVATQSVAAPQPVEPRGAAKVSKGTNSKNAAKEVDGKRVAKSFAASGFDSVLPQLQGLLGGG